MAGSGAPEGTRQKATYAPSGFFALRTPLLTMEEFEAWASGLQAPAAGNDPAAIAFALSEDRAMLSHRLREVFARSDANEALFLASPSLQEELSRASGSEGERAKLDLALTRYFTRMACRATPFGLFAGCTVGVMGRETSLVVAARRDYARRTRLDMDYLSNLAQALAENRELREHLRFRPNSSLYSAAERLRYAEGTFEGKERTYRLVAIEPTPALMALLECARNGATLADLIQAISSVEPEVDVEEICEFLDEVIEGQVLVSDLSPLVTGRDALAELIAQLDQLPPAVDSARVLVEATQQLADIDRTGIGVDPERYRDLAQSIGALPVRPEMGRTFQVDLLKPANRVTLSPRMAEELLAGAQILAKTAALTYQDPLEQFRAAFQDRYEMREVPLSEVLDEEIGIGFQRSDSPSVDGSPLLATLDFGSLRKPSSASWNLTQGHWLGRVFEAIENGRSEIELEEIDLRPLEQVHAPPLPDAFSIVATIAAPNSEAVTRGDYEVYVQSFGGPSGARLFGRFCDADPSLAAGVRAHLRAEELCQPEAVFAEIVHLPEGRIGNILFRPILRDYEIPFLGRSGTPPDSQIPITDLWVSVRGARVVLRSRRLGREVVPRLTTAHNYAYGGLGLYKFLGFLQSQSVVSAARWDWGPLEACPFLPRLRWGRMIFSLARWRLSKLELDRLRASRGADLLREARSLRERRRIPRQVELMGGDNLLRLDLENILCLETLAHLVKSRGFVILREVFPTPDRLLACGPEGAFTHELVVPFVRVTSVNRSAAISSESAPGARSNRAAERRDRNPTGEAPSIRSESVLRRSFPPGSEWLYAKLYTAPSNADRVLRELVKPLVEHARSMGSTHWFFIRFGDPEWHLRFRLRGDPRLLSREMLPALHAGSAPLLATGLLWRVQLDTYEREVERYGGPEAMELVESIFHRDSEAVLAILEQLSGDEGTEVRWRLALLGIEKLFRDLRLSEEAMLRLVATMRSNVLDELSAGPSFRHSLGATYRRYRGELDRLLEGEVEPEDPIRAGVELLEHRSENLRSAVASLLELSAAGRLRTSLPELAGSLAHMHANRMLRAHGRWHEVVIHDLLARHLESRAARRRQANVSDHAGPKASGHPVGQLERGFNE